MKIVLLILSFTVFSLEFTVAQTGVYHAFPDSDAVWCDSWSSCMFPILNQGTNTYQLSGKELINGIWYSRMLHSWSDCDNCSFCPDTSNRGIDTLYIRQDTLQKKVFLYSHSTNSDTIFLDFNLHTGDTLYGNEYWLYSGVEFDIVSSIDSILINGQYRTRYNFYSGVDSGCGSSMVEGIGPLHGFSNFVGDCFEHWSSLNFFEENHHILYTSNYPWDTVSAYQTYCYDFTQNIKKLNYNASVIYPNPAHDYFTINHAGELNIYDVMGRVVKEQYLTPSPSPAGEGSRVSLHCEPGVYFVRVWDGEKVYQQKLVIE